jgi:hypothetical protein
VSRARRAALWIGGAVVVVAIVVVVVILVARPGPWGGGLTSVAYSQSQAVPNFDDSTHTTTDPQRLAALTKVLRDDGWQPVRTIVVSKPGCAGGITTRLKLTLTGGGTTTLQTYRCGNDNDRLSADVTELVSGWRKAG